MNKRIISLILASLMCVPLVSCDSGNTENTDETTDTTEQSTEEVTTEAQTEAQTEEQIIFTEEEMDGKRVYRVARVAKKDEIDWTKIPAAAIDNYKWLECTEYKAYAQLVFAEDYGFICKMTCEESNPAATYTEMDSAVCFDSCMEFFVIFAGEKYLNLEANSIGTKCMGFGKKRDTRAKVNRKLKGGFDAIPEVTEDKWTLTYMLPMEQIQIFYPDVTFDTFSSGYEFSGNFYKTGSADITGSEHYGMWNVVETEGPDFHQPSFFGKFIME